MEREPENMPDTEVQDTAFFLEKLRLAREEGNIYLIARSLPFLMLAGIDEQPTEQEKVAMFQKLDDVRKGKVDDFFKGVEGYMLARWLMLVNHFWPGSEPATDEDVLAIRKAFEKYREDENFHQMASLVHTGKEIGIEIDTSTLTENERIEVEKVLTELK